MTKPNTAAQTKEKEKRAIKVISDNRRARHEYEVVEVLEAGIELKGTEVKSLRQGRVSLQDSFGRIEDGELWLYNCHISPYDHGNRFNHEALRKRKLLMHHRQILKLKSAVQEKGLTLIPLKLFFKGNLAKVDLALAKGKLLYDKRQTIAKRDTKRQIERVMKQAHR